MSDGEKEKKERFVEIYESILQKEELGCSYKTYKKDLNIYVAWICYLGIIYEFEVVQEKKESKIYDKWGNLVKVFISCEGEGDEKWIVLCEYDEKERQRANRYYAENIALAKLFNKIVSEVHAIWIRCNENIWEKIEGEENKWKRKMTYGDMICIEKVDTGYEISCVIKKENIKGKIVKNITDAQEEVVRLCMVEAIKRTPIICSSDKVYGSWLAGKRKGR